MRAPPRSRVWLRDLHEEGIEPQPGPGPPGVAFAADELEYTKLGWNDACWGSDGLTANRENMRKVRARAKANAKARAADRVARCKAKAKAKRAAPRAARAAPPLALPAPPVDVGFAAMFPMAGLVFEPVD